MHPARDRRSSVGRGSVLCTDPSPIPSWTMPGSGLAPVGPACRSSAAVTSAQGRDRGRRGQVAATLLTPLTSRSGSPRRARGTITCAGAAGPRTSRRDRCHRRRSWRGAPAGVSRGRAPVHRGGRRGEGPRGPQRHRPRRGRRDAPRRRPAPAGHALRRGGSRGALRRAGIDCGISPPHPVGGDRVRACRHLPPHHGMRWAVVTGWRSGWRRPRRRRPMRCRWRCPRRPRLLPPAGRPRQSPH